MYNLKKSRCGHTLKLTHAILLLILCIVVIMIIILYKLYELYKIMCVLIKNEKEIPFLIGGGWVTDGQCDEVYLIWLNLVTQHLEYIIFCIFSRGLHQ
jgi:hypothetical protein